MMSTNDKELSNAELEAILSSLKTLKDLERFDLSTNDEINLKLLDIEKEIALYLKKNFYSDLYVGKDSLGLELYNVSFDPTVPGKGFRGRAKDIRNTTIAYVWYDMKSKEIVHTPEQYSYNKRMN